MRVLGIDPGLKTGWALVEVEGQDVVLRSAGLGDPPRPPPGEAQVVIEKPVIYPHAKENPNDLITLAIQVGRYQERYGNATLVEARRWKGQVPKSVTEQRVRDQFPNAGQFLDGYPASIRHNVSDAIGLAWWEACRFKVRP